MMMLQKSAMVDLEVLLRNSEKKKCNVQAGQGIAQGIFMTYGITEDDDATETRNGGFGSTTK